MIITLNRKKTYILEPQLQRKLSERLIANITEQYSHFKYFTINGLTLSHSKINKFIFRANEQ